MQRVKACLPGNPLYELAAVDRHLVWRHDPESHAIAGNLHDGDLDLVTDSNGLTLFAAEHEHGVTPFLREASSCGNRK
jgi:hypothetical protein